MTFHVTVIFLFNLRCCQKALIEKSHFVPKMAMHDKKAPGHDVLWPSFSVMNALG